MNVFDFAKKMEKDGENYYRKILKHTSDEAAQDALQTLIQDEQRHYLMIEELERERSNMPSGSVEQDGGSNPFSGVRKIDPIVEMDPIEVEVYARALDMERASQAFYQKMAHESDSEEERKVLETLAAEEEVHCTLLDGILKSFTHTGAEEGR